MVCACRPDVRCQFHARQDRVCPCGGTLQRYAGKDGVFMNVVVPTENGFAIRGRGTMLAPRGGFWGCNRCERCEVA
jgi:hypothetical protein